MSAKFLIGMGKTRGLDRAYRELETGKTGLVMCSRGSCEDREGVDSQCC
jgi:hypothetical protein